MAEKIEITFLGTSSAVPTKTRNHTSILMKYQDENLLIDCGEGTQRQLRKAKINPCKITRLLITHLHGDHVFGIPGLFQTLNLNNYNKTLEIYGPKGIKKLIKDIFNAFRLTKSINIKIKINEIPLTTLAQEKKKYSMVLDSSDFTISSLFLEHGIPTLGYIFKEKDKLRINKQKLRKIKLSLKEKQKLKKLTQGKNIKLKNKIIKFKDLTFLEKGKKVVFILDTGFCHNAKKLAKDSDILICESTFLDKPEYKHLSAKQAAEIAKQSNVKKLILTHLSQRYEFKENLILKQAKKIFPNTRLAEDFLRIEI